MFNYFFQHHNVKGLMVHFRTNFTHKATAYVREKINIVINVSRGSSINVNYCPE